MARTANTPASPAPFSNLKRDPLLELDRLLVRLSQNILHATAEQERRLRRDEFERTKVRHDISAARSLLTQTEQSALSIKVHKRRTETQTDLAQKRETIEALLERVQVLEDLGRQEAGQESDDEDGEDLLAGIVMPAPSPAPVLEEETRPTDGMDATASAGEDQSSTAPKEKAQSKSVSWDAHIPPEAPQERASTTTTPALRARGKAPSTQSVPQQSTADNAPQPPQDTAHTTSSSARRAHLLGQSTERNDLSATAAEEAVLDHHRAEQDALTDDILQMARALRERSEATSKMLDDDKTVMDRVGDALHVTDTNMESAGKGMNVLARMTEGKGYIGRLILYAIVYGLMVALVLVFVTLPKLRC